MSIFGRFVENLKKHYRVGMATRREMNEKIEKFADKKFPDKKKRSK